MAKLSESDLKVLIEIYREVGVPSDALPYTEHFESLHAEFCARTGKAVTMHTVWRALSNLRKRSRLPEIKNKKGKAADSSVPDA